MSEHGHACGVFGVYAPGKPVAHLAYLGLFALQHRGQESAGIAVSDGETITVVKDMGLVTQVFDERRLAPLEGHLAIGHNRYSTTGSSSWRNAQPVYRSIGDAGFALGHNGNLTNTGELSDALGMLPGLLEDDVGLDSTTDSALVAELIAHEYPPEPRSDGRDLELALEKVLPRLEGGFSFVLIDDARLIGVRDPHGFWPLVLGRIEGGWVLASETRRRSTSSARTTSATSSRARWSSSTRRGSAPTTTPSRSRSSACSSSSTSPGPTPTSTARACTLARQRMGEELARQAPVDADMVMPVPESGIPAAQGFARASGIPYGDGLVKNRYIGRTFIAPTQQTRAAGRAPQAEPAEGEHRGQAPRRRRRLDRAGHHPATLIAHAARGRRRRGAPARHVAAVPLALLLRHGHRPALRAARRRPLGGRDPRLPRGRLPRLPRHRPSRDRHRRRRPRPSARPASPASTPSPCPTPTPSWCSRPRTCRSTRSPRRPRRDRPPSPARAAHLLLVRRRHRRRREGRRAHQAPRPLDVPARGRGRRRRLRRPVLLRPPTSCTTPCWWRRPTAWARSR